MRFRTGAATVALILGIPLAALAQTCMRNPVAEIVGGPFPALSPDGGRLAINLEADGSGQKVGVFDLPAGRRTRTLDGSLTSDPSPDRSKLLIRANGEFAFDISRGTALARWFGPGKPDGPYAVTRRISDRFAVYHHYVRASGSSSDYRTVRLQLIDLTDGRIAWDETRDFEQSWSVAFNGTNTLAAIYEQDHYRDGGGSRTVKVVDPIQAKEILRFREDFIPSDVSISNDGRFLATARDGARLRSLPDGKELARYPVYSKIRFLANGKLVLYGNGVASMVDPARPTEVRAGANNASIFYLTEHSNGRLSNSGAVFDGSDLRVVYRAPTLNNGQHPIGQPQVLRVSPDGKHALVYAPTDEWQLLDTSDGKLLCAFPANVGRIEALSNTNAVFGKDAGRDYLTTYTVLPLEAEGAAQAKSQSERDGALATSAGLSLQDRARAQGLFKQAFDLFQAGEFEAAIIGFQRGLAIDPASGLGHYYLAETYARQGKTTEARLHYRKTLDFAPDSKEALLAQTRIDKM